MQKLKCSDCYKALKFHVMPYEKQFISGFNFEEKQTKLKKKKFDKSSVIPDIGKSCHDCNNCRLLASDRKHGTAYQCDKKNYTFMNYWKQTIAPDCDSFNAL